MSDLVERLRTRSCTIHHRLACAPCIAQHEHYAAWWASFPTTPPALNFDDLDVERRNEITIVGYCRCGHWFTCRDDADRRAQLTFHRHCSYRNRIEWQSTSQLQLF